MILNIILPRSCDFQHETQATGPGFESREKNCLLPFEASFDEVLDSFLVDLLLKGIRLVDVVVGEGLVGAQPHLRLVRSLGDADLDQD